MGHKGTKTAVTRLIMEGPENRFTARLRRSVTVNNPTIPQAERTTPVQVARRLSKTFPDCPAPHGLSLLIFT